MEPEADDPIATLYQRAGRRPALSPEEVRVAKEAARSSWRRHLRRSARRRTVAAAGIVAALAAVLVLGIGLTLRRPDVPAVPRPLGRIELQTGEVAFSGPAAEPRIVNVGTVISTAGGGRAALRLGGGSSLRIDVASVVRIASASSVVLERGAVYVDTGALAQGKSAGETLAIATALGTVRHVGTQFEVRLLENGAVPESLRVRVREGLVTVDRDGEILEARAGSELSLTARGEARRAETSAHGLTWEWTERAAPPLEIEGAALPAFLDWVSRETGLPWRYATPDLRRDTERVVLHGSIAGLTLDEALTLVLPGCGYRHRRDEHSLLLTPQPAS